MGRGVRATCLPPFLNLHCQHKRISSPTQTCSILHTQLHDSKSVQSFFVLWQLTKPVHQHRPNVILSGVGEGHHTRGGEAAYKQYVRHLENSSPAVQASQTKGTVENFAQGYQDYLQAPLQVSASSRHADVDNRLRRDPAFDGQLTKCYLSDI
jgi:hypothetical protein